MNFDTKIIKTARKTISIEIKSDKSVIVRVPLIMKEKDIVRFIESKKSWIEKHLSKIDKCENHECNRLSRHEIEILTKLAKEKIPERAERFSRIMGLSYNKITIKKQTSRWGSCSSKKNLNFNFLLMLCPTEVQNYVIIHELCHLIELNHSKAFWSCVERYCPNYKEHKRWLKENGRSLIDRIK